MSSPTLPGKRTLSSLKLSLAISPSKRPRVAPPPLAVAQIAAVSFSSIPSTSSTSPSSSAFSLPKFVESLSTSPVAGSTVSERDLLDLECSSLDESWLALLQDELRKDYFVGNLKPFLWKEGVKGVGNSTGKVFPPGEWAGARMHMKSGRGANHLLVQLKISTPGQGTHL
jgi:hypothetical protein